MAMPGIIPRLKEFSTSGFGALAQLMALIYYSVRLLPSHHPYLSVTNVGKFGIRHVVAEAARHIEFKKENADQIVIFTATLAGMVLLIAQFALIIFMLIIHPAFAVPTPIPGFLTTQNGVNDIAFMLLDLVFGVPNVFVDANGATTCVASNTACLGGGLGGAWPSPFHDGLQALFRFYNTAILLVGVLIFLYYVIIVVGETAMTGTPFGKRFNHIWAPLRLVVAIGLLIPLNYGLNTAQYIVLYSAKIGSSFATNGWREYNNWINTSMSGVGSPDTNVTGVNETASYSSGATEHPLIAPTPVQSALKQVDPIVQFITLARACKIAYEAIYDNEGITIEAWLISKPFNVYGPATPGSPAWGDTTGGGVNPITPGSALEIYEGRDITIRFGDTGTVSGPGNLPLYDKETGGVFPFCGELVVHTSDLKYEGAMLMEQFYYDWILALWENLDIEQFAIRAACIHLPSRDAIDATASQTCASVSNLGGAAGSGRLPNYDWKTALLLPERSAIANAALSSYLAMQNLDTSLTPDIASRGWGGAGIWYNTIAEMNGSLQGVVRQTPTPTLVPSVMLDVQEARRAQNQNVTAMERYSPNTEDGPMSIHFGQKGDMAIATMLNDVYKYWRGSNARASTDQQVDSNPIFTVMNAVFGTDGLMNMRQMDNIHPLAQLSALGKGMMDATVRNLTTALAFSAAGGATEALSGALGGAFLETASAIVSVSTLGLTVGFILYYMLPILPFIYFFFAVSTWVKTIFEAMVGAPLWALAHLRIDGEGLPGQTAMNGYFLIFEIFIRPILTVFGLLAGMIVFTAMARTLNGLFPLLLGNTGGSDMSTSVGIIADLQFKRSILDEVFYTVIYTLLVYLIGTSSFKLIDQIPSQIMRWMGSGATAFADHHGDPTEGMVQYASIGATTIAPQVMSAAQKGAQAGGYAAGSAAVGLGKALKPGDGLNKVLGKQSEGKAP